VRATASRRGARFKAVRRAACLVALAFTASALHAAEGPACKQAREIVEVVKSEWARGRPDHATALGKLAMARDLCPALGEAWKYSYCSAKAAGDEKKARIYKDRAIFAGVEQIECAGTSAPVPTTGPVRAKYALLIGIGKFADRAIPELHFPAKDARDLKEVLLSPGHGNFDADKVFLLTDGEATRAKILSALNKISLRAKEDDLVLLFVSSHGSPRAEAGGLQGAGYILTYDSSAADIYLNSLDFKDLAEKFSLIVARRKVTFLDTCFSGLTKPGGKSLVYDAGGPGREVANLFLSGEGTYFITSSDEKEVSYESEALQNGYFTHYLIEALQAGSEPPTLDRVFSFVKNHVRDAVAREKGQAQNPRMRPEDQNGDLRIGVIPRPSD
jgi:hypothetical protein